MADPRPEILAQLKAIRETFALGLEDQLRELEEAWTLGAPATRLQNLRRIAHRLAGSGGTFGFPAMGQAARNLETFLQALEQGGSPPSPEALDEIPSRIQEVRRAASQEQAPQAPPDPAAGPEPSGCIRLFSTDPALRENLERQFTSFAFPVETHVRPADLVEALAQAPTLLAVIDTQLSGHDHMDLRPLANLQKTRDRPLPLIVLGEEASLQYRLEAVRAGAQAFFPKPVDPFSVLEKLDELNLFHKQDSLHVLIVEDDAIAAQHHSLTLRQAGMSTTVVVDPLDVMQPLVERRPDLILLDMYMPGCTGLELASVIRQQDTYLGIPIVFLSAEAGRDRQLEAMRMGADDFLNKPVDGRQLVSIVTSRGLRGRRLRSFMVRDSLTGLLNHSAMKEQLARELARASRIREPLSLAMIDLDHFKRVNDTHGHPGGDRVLRGLSRMLQQRLRKADVIGRYGGEEFVVVLPDTDGPQARSLLDSLRESFSAVVFPFSQEPRQVRFSCGVAAYPAFQDPAALTEAADKALYQAKSEGRNRVVLAGPP